MVVKLKKKKFYITTAIPYVDAAPHIGHALEFIQTDCITRYHKLPGDEVFLGTGSDENSLKNVQSAEKEGVSVEELCRRNAEKFRDMAKLLNVKSDGFLRSSSNEKHFPGIRQLWSLCDKRGDIYKKNYKGLFCVGCEAFYTESELSDGKCPEHLTKPEVVHEENYFFRLSRYQKTLEKLIETDKLKIYPQEKKNEVLSFIRSGLEDFSVSRSKERAKGWGIPVPGDESQIIYVWFDALGVYITVVGYGTDGEKFRKWWPCDCHVIGKGIIRFHAVYWPAILLSAGVDLPKSIFVHGYITVEGQKMSKTIGNVLDPIELAKKYGTDPLRYYMLREISPFDDGDFSEKSLVERVNGELVSNYSNLFYRVTYFIEKNFGGKVPEKTGSMEEIALNKAFEEMERKYHEAFSELKLNEALSHVMEMSSELNKYFQEKKPWEIVKKDKRECGNILNIAVNHLKTAARLLWPFVPSTAEKSLKLLNTGFDSSRLEKGHRITAEMLHRNLEYKGTKATETIEKIEVKDGMIPFKEFQKLDLRIGTITQVKDHPNADKLYILQVDLGGEKRQIVNGMREIHKKEELQGKQVIVIANLEKKNFRGVESHGMLLAADDGTLLLTEKKVKDGMKVR